MNSLAEFLVCLLLAAGAAASPSAAGAGGGGAIAAGVFLAPGAGLPGAGAGTGVPTKAFNSFSSTNTEPPAANVFRFAPARFTFDESIEPSRYTTSPGPGFKSGSVAVDLPGAPAFAVTVGDLPSLKIVTGLKTKNVIPSAAPITTLNAAPIVTSVQLGSYSPILNPENINSKNQDLAAGADGAAGLLGVASGVPLFFL